MQALEWALPFRKKTILQSVVDQLVKTDADEIILVTNPPSVEKVKDLGLEGVKIVINYDYKQGMTSSIKRGIIGCNKESQGFMICLADMPLIKADEYNRIINSFNQHFPLDDLSIAIPFFDGDKGNPVIFSTRYREKILDHKEAEGCREIVKENIAHQVRVEMDNPHVLSDIDTKEDYTRLIAQTDKH